MKTKKKFPVKLLATLLAVPLLLYGALCLYFYFEKQKAPLVTYQLNYNTNSNRSPADFKTDSKGNRVYMNKEGTESVACWDCYDKSWTEGMRNFIGRVLPSTLRAESQEIIPLSCGRGVAQAGMDIGVGMVVIVWGTISYLIETALPGRAELRKHRSDQAKYGFYFVIDGKIFKVASNSIKKLYNHIAKSLKEGDTFAICEATTVFMGLILGPKIKANWSRDKSKMMAREKNTATIKLNEFNENIKFTRQEIDNLQLRIGKMKDKVAQSSSPAKNELLYLESQKSILYKKLSTQIQNKHDYLARSPTGGAKVRSEARINDANYFDEYIRIEEKNLFDIDARITKNSNLLKDQDLQKLHSKLKMERKEFLSLKENYTKSLADLKHSKSILFKNRWFAGPRRFNYGIMSKQVAKSPLYLGKAIKQQAREIIPLNTSDVIVAPIQLATESARATAIYGSGRHTRKSGHETLEDYIDSLPQDVSP